MNIAGWVPLQLDCKRCKFVMFEIVLKISVHVEICNAY